MGDRTLSEFLRDLAIITSGVVVVWLLVITVIVILVFKRASAILTAVKNSVHNIQERSRALKDTLTGRSPLFSSAASGLGKLAGFLLRAAVGRRANPNARKRKEDTTDGE